MAKAAKKAAGEKKAQLKDYGVLRTPVITEKSSLVGMAGNRIVFKVDAKASKSAIKEAVEKLFNVNVVSVNTVNVLGKVKRTMRSVGRRNNTKKAYITLKEGQTIDIVEGL